MRVFMSAVTISLLLNCCLLQAADEPGMCRLRIRLVDASNGSEIPGLIRIEDSDGQQIQIPKLLDRGQGLGKSLRIHNWSVLPKAQEIVVPQQKVKISAFSGLETELTSRELNLTNRGNSEVTFKLRRFYDAHQSGYRNANTHVHLRKITKPESNRYLIETALGDGLDLVFVSYLARADDDVDYTTNRYSKKEIESLSTDHVHFGHGQEHRHNFSPYEEGYGHVMLLNIPELIYPVSIGPGISKVGTDGLPLQRGINKARETGGSVIWCHNNWGLEDTPNWLMGRLHANNIFDGGTHGSYQHSYYRYWNTGIKVPVSTGTDWFIYDFSRVYVPSAMSLSVEEWLSELRDGRSYITNGPLLEFSVNGNGFGEEIQINAPGHIHVKGKAIGRVNFNELQLVQSGKVIHAEQTQQVDGHFIATFDFQLSINDSCWLALRTPPPSVPNDAELKTPTPLNDYGRELFSHTSPTFVDLREKRIFDVSVANELLEEMRQNQKFIEKRGLFADDTEKQTVISVYREGITNLSSRIASAKDE